MRHSQFCYNGRLGCSTVKMLRDKRSHRQQVWGPGAVNHLPSACGLVNDPRVRGCRVWGPSASSGCTSCAPQRPVQETPLPGLQSLWSAKKHNCDVITTTTFVTYLLHILVSASTELQQILYVNSSLSPTFTCRRSVTVDLCRCRCCTDVPSLRGQHS